jgi:hypothetical protein
MKNAPLTKGERVSESRCETRQEETSTPEAFRKPNQPEDRAERFLPYHSPHGLQTDEELADFIVTHKPEGEV